MIRSSYHAEEQSAKYDVRARRRQMLAELETSKAAETQALAEV